MSRIFPRFLVCLMMAAAASQANTAPPLIKLGISDEGQINASEGGAVRELVQGEWRDFHITIDNPDGVASALVIESAQLQPAPPATPERDQWLRLELIPAGPLSGEKHETRKLRLWSDHSGVRSAVLKFAAGPDSTAGSDLLLNFKIKSANLDKDAARREALDWFRLFTRLPYEAPCELQAEMLDLCFEVYTRWIVMPEPDPDMTRVWLEKLRDLGSRTRETFGATRIEWRGDGLAVVDDQPVVLTVGLKRAVLLEIANRSEEALMLVPLWSGYKGMLAEAVELRPGESRLTWASIQIDNPASAEATLTLVRQNVAPEVRRELRIPLRMQEPAVLKGRILESAAGAPFPGRVLVRGGDGVLRHGKAFADNPTLSEKPHVPLMYSGHPTNIKLPFFYSDGSFEIAIAPGPVKVTLERGFEHSLVSEKLDLKPGETREITLESGRFIDMKSLGWISGDTHIHWAKNWWSEDEDIQLLKMVQRAEDIRVVNNLTLKHHTTDQNFIAPTQYPMGPIPGLCDDDYHAEMAQEYRNEEFYGHIILLNIKRLIQPISTGFMGGPPFWDWPHNVPAILEARAQGGISIEAHGLGRNNDVPVNVAQRLSDSLDQLEPHDYYRFLDCGFRVPLSNGSDHPARVAGVCRVYVKTETPFSYERWIEGFRKNSTFTTSGPLLFLTVNGQDIGSVLDVKPGTPLRIKARAVSRNPLGVFEIISNNRTLAVRKTQERQAEIEIDHIAGEPLWVVARASRSDSFNALNGPDIAHTSAIYVDVDGKARFNRDAAQEWINRMEIHAQDMEKNGRFPTDENRAEAVGHVRAGIEVYQKLIKAHADPSTSGLSKDGLTPVRGRIIDADGGQPLPARIYIRGDDGAWHYPQSEGGRSVTYQKTSWHDPLSEEHHSTLCAKPWSALLPPGYYTITVERGPEWTPLERRIEVGDAPLDIELPLSRWIHMAADGWFSGDTHVHRTLDELPNVMLAEDLNVAFPLTYWGKNAGEAPPCCDPDDDPEKPAELIQVDENHVIWPRNTEWEIFSVDGHDHTLGAVFALGHRTPIAEGAPPLREVVEEARAQGAIFDMDKPDWPWALALPPIMDIDLYELANNHMWRTRFAINKWFTPAPEWMLPNATHQGGERDWIEYTHQCYWAVLNCGRRLQPTAGTASGVHPVPLGFSRVYVQCPDGFTYDNWRKGLESGRSFVTTGPMCVVDVVRDGSKARFKARIRSSQAACSAEIIVNGRISETIAIESADSLIERDIPLDGTTWIALRVWEPRSDERIRFAHSAPVWFDDPQKPLRPRPEQAAFLIKRVEDEIERSRDKLPPEAIAEYEAALAAWRSFASDP